MHGQQANEQRRRATAWPVSRINALALGSLLTLSACSTGSSVQEPRAPQWSAANCPAPVVRIDRSFSAPFPSCVDALTSPAVVSGKTWLGRLIDSSELAGIQATCISEVAAWRDAERNARATDGANAT